MATTKEGMAMTLTEATPITASINVPRLTTDRQPIGTPTAKNPPTGAVLDYYLKAAPSAPTFGSLFGGLPLPVDPRNLLNLVPGLAAPCNLTGFLPSIVPFNPLGLLSGLFGSPGGCPTTARTSS